MRHDCTCTRGQCSHAQKASAGHEANTRERKPEPQIQGNQLWWRQRKGLCCPTSCYLASVLGALCVYKLPARAHSLFPEDIYFFLINKDRNFLCCPKHISL